MTVLRNRRGDRMGCMAASPSSHAHRKAAADKRGRAAVLTISDTRTPETDSGGDRLVSALEAADHLVCARTIVCDEAEAIARQIGIWIDDSTVDVVLTTGGTGIARRDTTIEVVETLIERPLPGFGELFRMLSYAEIGAAAMLSRASAGLVRDTFLFAMPGSPNAVGLAMDRLIIPELPHLLWESRRHAR